MLMIPFVFFFQQNYYLKDSLAVSCKKQLNHVVARFVCSLVICTLLMTSNMLDNLLVQRLKCGMIFLLS